MNGRSNAIYVAVFETLGIEPMFWKVCGDTNPLEGGKLYHQLSFLKRVWIFKGLCDTVSGNHWSLWIDFYFMLLLLLFISGGPFTQDGPRSHG